MLTVCDNIRDRILSNADVLSPVCLHLTKAEFEQQLSQLSSQSSLLPGTGSAGRPSSPEPEGRPDLKERPQRDLPREGWPTGVVLRVLVTQNSKIFVFGKNM